MNEQLLFPEAEPKPPVVFHAACFSGHRLDKLPTGAMRRVVLSMLQEEIRKAVVRGVTTFYTGMAEGIDLYAADYIRGLRESNSSLRLICVKPFSNCGNALRGLVRYQFNSVLASADAVIELSDHYYGTCFRMRNQYMIDHSDLLIAVMGESRSGTGQTIRMAQRRMLPVHLIDITDVERHISDRPVLVEMQP